MVLKLIDATEAKIGNIIMIEGEPCTVKGIDKSKTGKHGASKVRFESIGVLDNKKRITISPGHERFEVPMINKRKGQVLSKAGERFSLMDLESFETVEVKPDVNIANDIKEGINVEYWDVEGRKIIKRIA
jgi:translation initiation factor 5A